MSITCAPGWTAWRIRPTGCLELPISLARMAGTATRAFETFLNPRTLAWVAPLLTGFKIALKFLRRPKKGAASEEESHE